MKGRYVADLFAGRRCISRASERQGFRAHSWDIAHDPIRQDLLRPTVTRTIKQDGREGNILATTLAPSGQTFTIARDRAAVIRTSDQPWGLPAANLSSSDQLKVAHGNALARWL